MTECLAITQTGEFCTRKISEQNLSQTCWQHDEDWSRPVKQEKPMPAWVAQLERVKLEMDALYRTVRACGY